MKKKQNPATEWATPKGVMKNLGKRDLNIATPEENKKHKELVNTMGTRENIAHNKMLMRRYSR